MKSAPPVACAAVVEGAETSAVRVIAYEDLQCGDCAAYRAMLDRELLPKYASSVAFEQRDFPLPKHTWARDAAIVARYFDSVELELGVAFRRFCLENRQGIAAEAFPEAIRSFARRNGAHPEKAVAALDDAALQKHVEAQYREGVARGISRTPTVFVDGEPFIETFTFEEISKSIDAAIAAAGKSK